MRRLPTAATDVLALLSSRPWLALDLVDLVIATKLPWGDVLAALEALVHQGRVVLRQRDGRTCYSAAT